MIQYNHNRVIENGEIQSKGGLTLCVDLTDFRDKVKDLRVNDTIQLDIGIALCSKDDRYDKELGRQISLGRLNTIECTINDIFDISINNSPITIYIVSTLGILMQISLGKKARFLDCVLKAQIN